MPQSTSFSTIKSACFINATCCRIFFRSWLPGGYADESISLTKRLESVNAALTASYSMPSSMFHCTTRRNVPSFGVLGSNGCTPRVDAALLMNGVVSKRFNLICKASGRTSFVFDALLDVPLHDTKERPEFWSFGQ